MRKKQLTMQQGLALGCLILLVCAVVFGIVLRATRSHDLEDPEKVAAGSVDEELPETPLMWNAPPAPAAPQVKLVDPVLRTVLASVLWSSSRLLAPEMATFPEAAPRSSPPQVRPAPMVLVRALDASHVAMLAVVGRTPPTHAVVRLRLSADELRLTGAAFAEAIAARMIGR